MKLIDLTMPLYDGMPTGHGHGAFKSHPLWPEAFKKETAGSTRPGTEFHVYTMFCEQGTRLLLPSYRPEWRDDPARLDSVDLNKLILRDTVILDVPKGENEMIEVEELEAAFNKAPVQKGDALLIRTGWGDNERYRKMGHDFREKAPSYMTASGGKIIELLERNDSDLWLYDNSDMNGIDPRTGERQSAFTIRTGLIAIGGIVNTGAIKKERVKLIIAPLRIEGGHMGPCTVVAVEE